MESLDVTQSRRKSPAQFKRSLKGCLLGTDLQRQHDRAENIECKNKERTLRVHEQPRASLHASHTKQEHGEQ